MSPRRGFTSLSAASVAVLGVSGVIAVAPQASAEPCQGPTAAVQPTAGSNTAQLASPSALPAYGTIPTGHKPSNANDEAPLPSLGQLPRAILQALIPGSDEVDQQAAVVPAPTTQAPQPAAAAQPAAQPTPAAPPGTSLVGWVTGPDSPNNTVQKYAITGTDLGIMWDNGSRQVLMAFGDTYGFCSIPGSQWRYNVLFRSQDGALSNTVAVSDAPMWAAGLAKQIINSVGRADTEKGIIPTAGIAVGNTQLLNFMSIRNWDAIGYWSTNFSAIAMSTDNGEHWNVYPGTIRTPGGGNENFQQGAFLKPGPGDPYLYSFGTPSGRSGSAYVARVAPGYVPDLTKYEYWNGDTGAWVPSNPAAATPVIPGPVGEMSVQYNTYLKQYLTLYGNGANDVVMRTAPAPNGPWGPEQVLVASQQIPGGIYAPYLHPWSTGKELYFNLSLWSAYNVMLMRTVLT